MFTKPLTENRWQLITKNVIKPESLVMIAPSNGDEIDIINAFPTL